MGGNSWNVLPWKAGEIDRISKFKTGFQRILGHEIPSQTPQGTSMYIHCSIPSVRSTDAGRERTTHHQQPCALHWTFHKTGLNAAPLWTYRMFLPLFKHPASQVQPVHFLIYSSKKSIVTVTPHLKHLHFIFKNQRRILQVQSGKTAQVWKQSTNLVLLHSLASKRSQLTRETLQNRHAQKRTFSITNIHKHRCNCDARK